MPPDYIETPEQIRKNVQMARNSISPRKNCLGNTLFLIGIISKERYVHTDIKGTGGLLEECAEKESTMISLETIKGCQRKIIHVMLIDPLNREVVYCRNGLGREFAEGNRDFILMSYLREAEEDGMKVDVKYCKINYRHLYELIKNTKMFREYKNGKDKYK